MNPEHEELTPRDDAIIGRAFRRSLVVLLVVGAVVGGISFLLEPHPPAPQTQLTQLDTPASRELPVNEIPVAKFTDITKQAGVTFVHNNGAYGEKLLPETMGGGVAFFDFDNDGAPDLLFINSTYWPGHVPEGKQPTTLALYHNDGQGHFRDVTAGSGLDLGCYGMGVAIGDYDNDGLDDVFITAVGGNHLFHNEGNGKFQEVTATAAVSGTTNDWSTCAAWIDYDNDGRLDLFVGNYVQWSREIDFQVDNRLVGVGRAYGRPMNFPGSFPRLYHNEGSGRFADVSAQAGIQVKNKATGLAMAKTLGVAPVDLDGDGWIDLVVANDTVQNFVFHNEHNGTFKEIGAVSGIAFDNYGGARGAMGIDAGRFQEDNSLGISIGNFANEMTAFYVSQNDPLTFTDEAIKQGIGTASRQSLTFGVFFFDYDLDGWLDLLTANGHLDEDIGKLQSTQRYRQPAQLFWNARGINRKDCFLPVPPGNCGPDIFKPIVGRGSAFADLDGDGDLDVVLTQINGPPLLLRNDQPLHHHWLRFKLVGTKCNRDAIGAWVRLRVNGRTLWRQVMPTRGYLSQSELAVTFGLDKSDRADEITVIWPDASKQKVDSVRLDTLNVIQQSRERAVAVMSRP